MSSIHVLAVLVLSALTNVYSQSDTFTNPYVLEKLFRLEILVLNILESTSFTTDESFQRYSKSRDSLVEDLTGSNIRDKLVPNPIHTFGLMRRLANEWHEFMKKIKLKLGKEADPVKQIYAIVSHFPVQSSWPRESDVRGAAMGLARIQHVYQLPLKDMVKGKLRNRPTKARLSADDCLFIAVDRLEGLMSKRTEENTPEYALGIEWLEVAEGLAREEGNEDLLRKIQKRLAYERLNHDAGFRGMDLPDGQTDYPNEEFFIERVHVRDAEGSTVATRTSVELREKEKQVTRTRSSFSMRSAYGFPWFHYRDYYQLCRGETLNRTVEDEDEEGDDEFNLNLQCHYIDHNDPFLLIQPIKVEVLSEDPVLWLFHDIIYERDMEQLKMDAVENLGRAGYADIKSDMDDTEPEYMEIPVDRTAANGWLSDGDNPRYHLLSKRLSHYLNLDLARPDDKLHKSGTYEIDGYQVGVYSPGGHYLPHCDAGFGKEMEFTDEGYVGNRIGTLMFYFSEVDGGGTAFPNIGKVAFPKKGSAVFWYSLDAKGMLDQMSVHGACPTIFGIKWVTNVWIREGPQIFKRPCGLQKNGRILHDVSTIAQLK